MSSPIKPPGGPTGPNAPDELEAPSKTNEASEAFQKTLDRTSATDDAAAAGASDPVVEVARDIRAGRIDVSTAIDRLVEQAMSSRMVESLTPAGRVELEAHLRRTLAEDPTLVSLARDLERGD